MLIVKLQSGHEERWKIGELNPFTTYLEINNIIEIKADGDELEYIKQLFRGNFNLYNIPVPRDRSVVSWFGDTAKSIASAL